LWKKKNNSGWINHPSAPSAITIPAAKVGLQYQKSDTFKDDGEVTRGKYVRGFPELRTYGEEYKD